MASPPTSDTLARLCVADGGYERASVLRALLAAGGNEEGARVALRAIRDTGDEAAALEAVEAYKKYKASDATGAGGGGGAAEETTAATVVDATTVTNATIVTNVTHVPPGGASGGGGGGGGSTIATKLRELAEARSMELITQAEFAAARAKILGLVTEDPALEERRRQAHPLAGMVIKLQVEWW